MVYYSIVDTKKLIVIFFNFPLLDYRIGLKMHFFQKFFISKPIRLLHGIIKKVKSLKRK